MRPSPPAVVVLLGCGCWLGACGLLSGPSARFEPPHRDTLALPAGVAHGLEPAFAVSPDGSRLAFAGTDESGPHLFLYSFDSGDTRTVSGTDRGTQPFWAPDGRNLGYFVGTTLWRVGVDGGAPVSLAEAFEPCGATWGSRGVIVYASRRDGVSAVPEGGGAVRGLPAIGERLSTPCFPQFLPDGAHFLIYGADLATPTDRAIHVASLEMPDVARLVESESSGLAVWTEPGEKGLRRAWLFSSSHGSWRGQILDLERRALVGASSPFDLRDVYLASGHRAAVSASDTGRIVALSDVDREASLTWVDRTGTATGTEGRSRRYGPTMLAPDGGRLAFAEADARSGVTRLWLSSPGTPEPVPLELPGQDEIADVVWAPDGTRVAFASRSPRGVFVAPAVGPKGGAEPKPLSAPDGRFSSEDVSDWSRDGTRIAFTRQWANGNRDIWAVPADGSGPPVSLAGSPFRDDGGRFSPDGEWFAYTSNETGADEIYVVTATGPTFRSRVSVDGGRSPVWSPDGRELFFLDADDRVSVARADELPHFSPPTRLFASRLNPFVRAVRSTLPLFSVSPDGQRLLINRLAVDVAHAPLTALTAWASELNGRAQ